MTYVDQQEQCGGYPPAGPLQQPIAPPPSSVFAFRPPAVCQHRGFVANGPHRSNNPPTPVPPVHPSLVSLPPPAPSTTDGAFIMSNMYQAIENVFCNREEAENDADECCTCGEKDSTIVCGVCQAIVCYHCLTEHNREHILYSSETTLDASPPNSCSIHEDSKVTLFCQSCLCTVCPSCAVSSHCGHSVLSVNEAYTLYGPSTQQQLGKSQVEINLLDLSLVDAEKMCTSVREKQSIAVETVRRLFQDHRTEVDKKEKEVCVCGVF